MINITNNEKQISPWISMRMNDVHFADKTDHYYHSSFWRNNPSFWRVPNEKSDNWNNQALALDPDAIRTDDSNLFTSNRALNYVHPEVREHQMSIARWTPQKMERITLSLAKIQELRKKSSGSNCVLNRIGNSGFEYIN
jgi:hypothetical protein